MIRRFTRNKETLVNLLMKDTTLFPAKQTGYIKVMQFPEHTVKMKKLPSGSTLVHVVAPRLPYSIAGIFVRAGSRFDPSGKEGVAHFFEHLLLTRTEAFPKTEDRLKRLESVGIASDATTFKEFVTFRHTQTQERTLESLELLIEGLNYSLFTQADVEREKSVVLDEIAREEKETERVLWEAGSRALWPKSLLGRSIIGTRKSVSSVTIDDLIHFKDTRYHSKNIVFVVIGREDIFTKVEKIINDQYKRVSGKRTSYQDDLSSPIRTAVVPGPFAADADTNIEVGLYFKTIPLQTRTFKEQITLSFVRDYLSNTWISKLIGELRLKRGWTYWISGDSGHFSDTGFLEFTFSTNKKDLVPSIEICLSEIQKIKSGQIDNGKEFASHKTAKIAGIVKAYDPDVLFSWYGENAILETKLFGPNEYIDMIEAISPRDMQKTAKKYLTKENCSLVVLSQKDKKLEARLSTLVDSIL